MQLNDCYNTQMQRIFFIDEAHRGYNPKGSFLANLLEADKNAIKIALTGTPLLKEERESWRVFGDYIHTYYYDKSIFGCGFCGNFSSCLSRGRRGCSAVSTCSRAHG